MSEKTDKVIKPEILWYLSQMMNWDIVLNLSYC
jgi:hypothetical protein